MQITFNGFEITGTPSEVFEFVNMKDVKAKPVEVPKEKPKAATKKPATKTAKKKQPVDIGKIKALRNGNWTLEKIADEMRLSVPTIRKYLNEGGAA